MQSFLIIYYILLMTPLLFAHKKKTAILNMHARLP